MLTWGRMQYWPVWEELSRLVVKGAFQDAGVESSGRFPELMKGTMLENLYFFHLFNHWWTLYTIQGNGGNAACSHNSHPSPSFVMELWFLARHMLCRIRTVFQPPWPYSSHVRYIQKYQVVFLGDPLKIESRALSGSLNFWNVVQ